MKILSESIPTQKTKQTKGERERERERLIKRAESQGNHVILKDSNVGAKRWDENLIILTFILT